MRIALPSNIKKIIDEEVIQPILYHALTEAWNTEIGSKILNGTFKDYTKDYIRNTIVEQGQADFTTGYNGLTPDDKVLLYAYCYFQMHFSSTMAVLEKYKPAFENYIWKKCKGVAFLDVGCGPLTSGLALLELSNKYFKPHKPFDYTYVGIDIAKAMIDLAIKFEKAIPRYPQTDRILFNKSCYETNYKEIVKYKFDENIGIIINCCYFFASPTIEVNEFIKVIKTFVEAHKNNKLCLIYQNAPSTSRNVTQNYETFLKQISVLKNATNLEYLPFSFVDEFNSTKYKLFEREVSHQLLIKNDLT